MRNKTLAFVIFCLLGPIFGISAHAAVQCSASHSENGGKPVKIHLEGKRLQDQYGVQLLGQDTLYKIAIVFPYTGILVTVENLTSGLKNTTSGDLNPSGRFDYKVETVKDSLDLECHAVSDTYEGG